jgi:hypothetical protein
MGRFFQEGIKTSQKLMVSVLVAFLLGALFYFFFLASFVPTYSTAKASLYASVLIVGSGLAIGAIFRHVDRWNIAPSWTTTPLWKKLVAAFFGPPLLVFVVWTNLAHTIPWVVTSLIGTPSTVTLMAEKANGSPRSGGCRREIELQPWWRELAFRWCISEQAYQELPDGFFRVHIAGKGTMFGILADSVLVDPGAKR